MRQETTGVTSERVLRLSLSGVLIALALMVLAGLTGGVISRYLGPGAPLPIQEERFSTTVQEVTISPNTARHDVVRTAESSVYLLVRTTPTSYDVLGTAVALTNDGLLATLADFPDGTTLAVLDTEGRLLPVSRVGEDVLYGISYVRLANAIVTPLDIAPEDSAVGSELLLLSRDPQSLGPLVSLAPVNRYTLPTPGLPAGIQRVLVSTAVTDTHLIGSPVLNEEGQLSGLMLETSTGRILPATHMRASFERLAAQQREANPLPELGLTIAYTFTQAQATQEARFAVLVEQVTPNSPAQRAGLRRGDRIIKIGDTELQWETSAVPLLQDPLPLTLTFQREGEERVITLSLVPAE